MVQYAMEDVVYLSRLHSALEKKCCEFNEQYGRREDYMQQMVYVESEKVAGLWRLNPHIQIGHTL